MPTAHLNTTRPYAFEDLTGKQFGCITVDGFSHELKPFKRYWNCHCICGRVRIHREDYIKSGASCRACRTAAIQARTGPRRCPKCTCNLERGEFFKDKHTTDGLSRYCKKCHRSNIAKLAARRRRRRPAEITVPLSKKCKTCHLEKMANHFWTDLTQEDGLARHCADCRTEEGRKSYTKHRAERLSHSRAKRYGLTNEQLERMMMAQGRLCGICGKELTHSRSWCVDHDHKSGTVRGLLCNSCNTAIALMRDSVETLAAAIRYIQRGHALV